MDEDFQTTTSHVVIRSWAESHGGKPALIVDPNRFDKQVGLRLDFPGKSDEALLSKAHHNKDVSWEEFFKVFEEQELAFDYLEEPGDTDLVDAYRFLKREALKEESATPFNTEDFAKAIRDGEPAFFTHAGKADDPHAGEIEPVETEDMIGEKEVGSSVPDLESDDDTTQGAKEAGALEPHDPQAKHDQD